jgi:hypothetical protein
LIKLKVLIMSLTTALVMALAAGPAFANHSDDHCCDGASAAAAGTSSASNASNVTVTVAPVQFSQLEAVILKEEIVDFD